MSVETRGDLKEKKVMSEASYKYIWRCAKCASHFVSISRVEGVLRQEKKCPKCKSLNSLTLTEKEIIIHCRLFEPQDSCFREESENYPYPD